MYSNEKKALNIRHIIIDVKELKRILNYASAIKRLCDAVKNVDYDDVKYINIDIGKEDDFIIEVNINIYHTELSSIDTETIYIPKYKMMQIEFRTIFDKYIEVLYGNQIDSLQDLYIDLLEHLEQINSIIRERLCKAI